MGGSLGCRLSWRTIPNVLGFRHQTEALSRGRMHRRELITLFGGTAAMWPLTARAQSAATPVIGFLHPTSPDAAAERLRGFRQGLKDIGYVEGENVMIESRWAEGQND